jgi:hypothetical protein
MRLVVILAALLIAPAAHADRCLASLDESRYAFERGKEDLAQPGERFLGDLRPCNPQLVAAVEEAVRYQIHDDEAKKFARNTGFVQLAYGVAWAVLAAAALGLYLRQRRLQATIEDLRRRLEAHG